MVASPNPVQLVRLSPSGPEIGTPGALIGGGALIAGRLWTAQGTPTEDPVETPSPLTDVPGLGSVAVDMRAGYSYDVEVDAQFFGTYGQPQISVSGSSNGGSTYSVIDTTLAPSPSGHTNSQRLHTITTGPYDHLKVQVVNAAGLQAECTYSPQLTALKVREYSTS